MAISLAHIAGANVNSNVDATSATSGSFTPASADVLLAAVGNTKGTTPETPTFSNSLGDTWAQIGTIAVAGAPSRMTVFWSKIAAASSMTVTADAGGVTQTGWFISVALVTGSDQSTFFRASNVDTSTAAPAASAVVLNLPEASFLDTTNNAWYEAVIRDDNAPVVTTTDGAGAVNELVDNGHSTPNGRLQAAWGLQTVTTITMTDQNGTDTGRWAALGFEILVAAAAGGAKPKTLLTLGVG